MSVSRFAVLPLLILMLSACQAMPHVDPGDTRKLLETDVAFAAKSSESGTGEAFYNYMTETGVQVPASGEPIQGRAAIREYMAGRGKLLWQPQSAEVAVMSDLGWTWGEWHRLDSNGREIAHGRYVNIWKKQADGNWHVSFNLLNTAQ